MKRSTNFQRRAPAGGGLLGRAALALERLREQNAKLRAVAEAAERVRIADEQGGMQAKRSALSALYAALDALPADSSGAATEEGKSQ